VKQYLYLKTQGGIPERQAAKEVASRFGISVCTLRRWAQNYKENGFNGLRPKSTRPKKIVKRVSQEVVSLILAVRAIYGWGAQRIAQVFKEQELGKFSHMFVHRLFDKYHVPVKVYHPRAPRSGIHYRRYQKRAGNQQWHIDFKGPLSIGPLKVWIFVCIDDATRFCLAARGITSCSAQNVIDELTSLFQRYGKPERICTDNGRAFSSVWENGNHPFEDFLDEHEITHDLITPFYPESNGKAEALIRTIQHECLQWYLQTRHKTEFESSQELQMALDKFIEYYNWFRAHSALGYRSPGSAYAGAQPQQIPVGGSSGY
jgi:putative transposase